MTQGEEGQLEVKLFSLGKPTEPVSSESVMFEQYKMFVDTSENLVARRQTANRFFFSANALTMSAIGVGISLIGDGDRLELIVLGIFVLSVAGVLFCIAWRRLIQSFAQLNEGKFKVIHEIEKILPVALFTAEWYVLGEGKNPERYKSSTSTEKIVPMVLMVFYVIVAAIAVVFAVGVLPCFGQIMGIFWPLAD